MSSFHTEVFNASMHEKGFHVTRTEPRPVMKIVTEFMDEKIARALYEEKDPFKAFEAMGELREVLSSLVKTGRPEFKTMLAIADDALVCAIKLIRDHLVKKYLDSATPEERAEEIKEMLIEIISRGAWPNWQEEYDDAVWARVMDQLARRDQGQIYPWDWAC
jgi:hypothetical protein